MISGFNDINFFKEFYHRHFNAVVGFCFKYVKEREAALDISQDAMYRVYKAHDSKYPYESSVSFLYTIARNLCLDYIRRNRFKFENIDSVENIIGDDKFFLDEITRQETIGNIRNAVRKLNGRSLEIILLTLKGKSTIEISEILGISINTVKSLKKTAFSKLRETIGNENIILLIYFSLPK